MTETPDTEEAHPLDSEEVGFLLKITNLVTKQRRTLEAAETVGPGADMLSGSLPHEMRKGALSRRLHAEFRRVLEDVPPPFDRDIAVRILIDRAAELVGDELRAVAKDAETRKEVARRVIDILSELTEEPADGA